MKNKYFIHTSLLFTLILFCLFFSSCKKSDPGPTRDPNDEVKAKLTAGIWNIQNVTAGGVDRTTSYTGMTLTISATSFTATNGQPVWPNSGTWSFAGSDGTSITRGDGLVINILELTANSMKLGLVWSTTTYGPGRIGSVSGNHVFTFSK